MIQNLKEAIFVSKLIKMTDEKQETKEEESQETSEEEKKKDSEESNEESK